MMRSRWLWFGASLLAAGLLLAAPAGAAVVQEHRVSVEVQPDGSVRERVSWRVRVDDADDFERWSPFPILLDTHRRLLRLEAAATPPDGRPQPVKRKARDRAGIRSRGALHESQEVEVVEFPPVPDGSVLSLEYEVEERPYFPSGVLPLGGEDAVASLRVELRGPGLRARLVGAPPGASLVAGDGSAMVSGALSALSTPERAPSNAEPVLRYAWGPSAEWATVGRWYRDLVAEVPRDSAAVRETAKRLTAGVAERPQMVERLTDFVRGDVRYVAVEIGIGGYRPAAPEQVLTRRWGDCKDKALLLVDLLAAVGIESRLVLVRSDDEGGIDTDFPSPDEFNHVIVALPAAVVTVPGGAPAAGKWHFLDATQTQGGLSWLHPGVAGQQGLLVTPDGGELVAIPLSPASESRRLFLTAQIGAGGDAAGTVRYELEGERAAFLTHQVKAVDAATVVAHAGEALERVLPGASFEKVEVRSAASGPPAGRITASLRVPTLASDSGDAISLLLPARATWPSAGIVADRALPVTLAPGVTETEWRLTLPRTGCRLESAAAAVDNALGRFEQEAMVSGDTLLVRRRSELRARQAPVAQFADLTALATAENRALKRRLRLDCAVE